MRILNLAKFFLFIILLSACFKEDEKVTPHDPGDVETDSVKVAQNGYYYYQAYYDLGSKEIVSTNLRSDWDLGFECSAGATKIILNSSNFMVAAKTGLTDFNSAIDTAGYIWQFDASSGNPDTTAFSDWVEFT